MTLDADVLILGGGCAGLSLAVALAKYAPHLRVLTLEKRSQYTRDRTWCFWNTTDHPFQAGITHAWNQWRVRANGRDACQHSAGFCYQHLPADHFYAIAQERMAAAGQQLAMGADCGEVRATEGGCTVETSLGALNARHVFDGRPPDVDQPEPLLWQRFLGWHVRVAQPCFDPDCVDLMDFQSSDEQGRTVFFYVLPFSASEALVEVTYLDLPSLVPEDGRARLRERMSVLCAGAEYEVLYEEAGALPMGQSRAPHTSTSPAVPIGTLAGRVKPSSGYAFQRIQRQSRLLAEALATDGILPRHYEPQMYGVLDSIFLAALQRRPQQIPAYFLQLFSRVRPEALIPFLSETADLKAVTSTMWALPKLDFVQAALAATRGSLA